jgi:hypothetical protein
MARGGPPNGTKVVPFRRGAGSQPAGSRLISTRSPRPVTTATFNGVADRREGRRREVTARLYKHLLSRARKQAKMSRGNQNPLRDIRTNESQSRFSDDVSKARTATEVVAALEQLSPKASLIRNARLNW